MFTILPMFFEHTLKFLIVRGRAMARTRERERARKIAWASASSGKRSKK